MRAVERFVIYGAATVLLVALYAIWARTADPRNIAVMAAASAIVSLLFVRAKRFPRVTPKRIIFAAAYIPYLFIAIVKANFDVARRVVRRRIPINPGIVTVRTRLNSPTGRTILANSITLTPGTLSVDMRGDKIYVHWIDVADTGKEGATERIVAGFERYLEVIFG
jgi:multicomponent Na+:H+ antiporter subunit E